MPGETGRAKERLEFFSHLYEATAAAAAAKVCQFQRRFTQFSNSRQPQRSRVEKMHLLLVSMLLHLAITLLSSLHHCSYYIAQNVTRTRTSTRAPTCQQDN